MTVSAHHEEDEREAGTLSPRSPSWREVGLLLTCDRVLRFVGCQVHVVRPRLLVKVSKVATIPVKCQPLHVSVPELQEEHGYKKQPSVI